MFVIVANNMSELTPN